MVLYAPTWRDTVATSPWTAKLFDGLDLESLAEQLGNAMPFCCADTITTFGKDCPSRGRCGTCPPIRRSTTFCLAPTLPCLTIPPFASTGNHGKPVVLRARPGGLSELAQGFVRLQPTAPGRCWLPPRGSGSITRPGNGRLRVRCRPGTVQQGVQQASRRACDGTGHQCVSSSSAASGSLMSSSTVSSCCWPSPGSSSPSPARHGRRCGCWIRPWDGWPACPSPQERTGVEPARSVVGSAGTAVAATAVCLATSVPGLQA